MIYLKKIWVRR
uniref:Uncharacterized protein n=1 Tax=Rhizophora mucronata TaxID=61149 RepID=A0A2P2P334_RHIMU